MYVHLLKNQDTLWILNMPEIQALSRLNGKTGYAIHAVEKILPGTFHCRQLTATSFHKQKELYISVILPAFDIIAFSLL